MIQDRRLFIRTALVSTLATFVVPSCQKNTESIHSDPPKKNVVGSIDIEVKIKGAEARLITSKDYKDDGEPDTLMIICHGNGQTYESMPSEYALDFFSSNKISIAIINVQIQSKAPYDTKEAGWGNDIALRRNIDLYDYLLKNYNFNKSVILAGQSMGGLVVGHFAYSQPFPIRFCLGIGPVPSLKAMFVNDTYPDQKRKAGIRAAYGMNPDGSQDGKLDYFINGYDWRTKGSVTVNGIEYKSFGPHLYIFAGTGDAVFAKDFGGTQEYVKIKNAINASGGICTYEEVKDIGHADPSLYDNAIRSGVFLREMGLAIP